MALSGDGDAADTTWENGASLDSRGICEIIEINDYTNCPIHTPTETVMSRRSDVKFNVTSHKNLFL